MAGYYGFTLDVRVCVCLSIRPSVHPSVIHPSKPTFRVRWFNFVTTLCRIVGTSFCFSFPDDNLSKHKWIFTKLSVALILWKSGLGLQMGKFSQIFTEFSAHDTIMAGYYSLTFCFFVVVFFVF